jgi:hypothetical protein
MLRRQALRKERVYYRNRKGGWLSGMVSWMKMLTVDSSGAYLRHFERYCREGD